MYPEQWWNKVEIRRRALLSDKGTYRYWLARSWDPKLPGVAWVMLNPSKADAEIDDPTMLKVMTFSRNMAFGSCTVVNLAAYRSASPREMMRAQDPFGLENEVAIAAVLAPARAVVVAWGANGEASKWPAKHRARLQKTKNLVLEHDWACLGMTKAGEPKHPLYLPYSTELTNLGRTV